MASGIAFENLFVEEMFRFNYFSAETTMIKQNYLSL